MISINKSGEKLIKETLNVGVVGLGKMGLLHSCIVNVLPDAKLTAVCEKSNLMRKVAKKVLPNLKVVDDLSKFADLNLDAVYITTPTSSHYAVAKSVYEQNIAKNVFIEKPLAASYSQSTELCDLAEKTGGINMVGYLRRFYVTFQKAKELLDQKVIGQLQNFEVKAYSADFVGVKDNTASIGRGGVLRDLGSYAIDLSVWFFGDIQFSSGSIAVLTGPNAEDSAVFQVQTNLENLPGQFEVSWCKEGYRMPEVILSIKGSKGIIDVNDDTVSLTREDGQKNNWFRMGLKDNVKFWLGNPEYYREDLLFIDSIRTNHQVEPSFKSAAKVDLLIENIRQKAKKI
jgi:predicted dehydrogenase